MKRRLTTHTRAVEVSPLAPLAAVPCSIPKLATLTMPAGTILEGAEEENDPTCVRVTWQGVVWRIDKADWDSAESV
jgi:hypothetical protein